MATWCLLSGSETYGCTFDPNGALQFQHTPAVFIACNELTEHGTKDRLNVITLFAVLVVWQSQSYQKTLFLKSTMANVGLMAENIALGFVVFSLAATETDVGASGASCSSAILTGFRCRRRWCCRCGSRNWSLMKARGIPGHLNTFLQIAWLMLCGVSSGASARF